MMVTMPWHNKTEITPNHGGIAPCGAAYRYERESVGGESRTWGPDGAHEQGFEDFGQQIGLARR